MIQPAGSESHELPADSDRPQLHPKAPQSRK